MERLFLILLIGPLIVCRSFLYGQSYEGLKPVVEVKKNNIFNFQTFSFWETYPGSRQHFKTTLRQGKTLTNKGKFHDALSVYQSILPYLLPFDTSNFELYNEIAVCYERIGNFEQSINFYLKTLENVEANSLKQAALLINIASSLTYIKDFEKANFYADKALFIFNEKKDVEKISITLATKARIHTETRAYNQAISTYLSAYSKIEPLITGESESVANKTALNSLASGIMNNIADIYLKKSEPDSALYYLNRINYHINKLSLYIKNAVLVSYGQAYSQKSDYQTASAYMEQGLMLAQESGIKEIAIQAHRALSDLYGKQGNYKKAWEHEQAYVVLNESMFATKKLHQINNLETKYHLAKKDKEITSKQLKIKEQESRLREKNLWVYLTLLGLFFSTIILFIVRKNYKNKQKLFHEKLNSIESEKKIMQIEATLKGEEKERIRIARELHDGVVSEMLIMNLNLRSIEQDYSILKHAPDYKSILLQAEEIAHRLRQTAHNLMPLNLREQGVYASIKAFLDRINNSKIQFSFQHYGELPALKEEVGKMILFIVLELIQNIIKHSKATEALIQLNYFEDVLSITIEDNGVGMTGNAGQSTGMGLNNLRENIKLLNATMDIKSSEYTGTTILIEILINEHRAENQCDEKSQIRTLN